MCCSEEGPSQQAQETHRSKAVKSFEIISSNANGISHSSLATTFRAISARAKILAQDREDGAHSSSELCREFAAPNEHSLQNHKRLVRFYKGGPRLVYKYPVADKPISEIDVF